MKITDLISNVGRPICYYPSLAKLIGVKETIFLCHVCFWSGKGHEGWIYRTAADLYEETGLSKKEQATIRDNLSKAGLIEDKRGRNCFFIRPCPDKINTLWESGAAIDYEKFEKLPNGTSEQDSTSDVWDHRKLPNGTSGGGGSYIGTEEEQRGREKSVLSLSNDRPIKIEKRKRNGPFRKPSVDEMIDYGATFGVPEIEAKKCHNYYEMCGWTVGKAAKPMVDWKAALQNWKIGWKERNGQKQRPTEG